MKTKGIVINTSPWIALSLCGKTSLLKAIYSRVLMPEQVKKEILRGGPDSVGVKELKTADWLQVQAIKNQDKIELLYELDKGEAEVIILAKDKGIQQVLIDEKIARQQASVLGLQVRGTLGLLLHAKKRNLIPELKPLIAAIRENGIWIKDDIVQGILREAGELDA